MKLFVLWKKIENGYIYGTMSNFKKELIGWIDAYGNERYYSQYDDYEDISDDYEPEQEPAPRQLSNGKQNINGADWNRYQQRKHFKTLRENLNNSSNPDYTRPQKSKDIQFKPLQHNDSLLKGAGDLMKQLQQRQQANDENVLKSVIDFNALRQQQEENLRRARGGSIGYGMSYGEQNIENMSMYNDKLLEKERIIIKSTTTDVNARKVGERGFDRNNMMPLFSVDVYKDSLKPYDEKILLEAFQLRYTITQANVIGEINYNPNNREQATVINVSRVSLDMDLMVKISISDLENLRKKAVKRIDNNFTFLSIDKLNYFNSGKEYDIKHTLLKDRAFVYIEGVGLFESDFIGNLFYGSVMGNLQNLRDSLNDGDLLQNSGIDDPMDSYAIILGHLYGKDGITENTFNNMKNVSLYKQTRTQGKFYHTYLIKDIKLGSFEIKTSN